MRSWPSGLRISTSGSAKSAAARLCAAGCVCVQGMASMPSIILYLLLPSERIAINLRRFRIGGIGTLRTPSHCSARFWPCHVHFGWHEKKRSRKNEAHLFLASELVHFLSVVHSSTEQSLSQSLSFKSSLPTRRAAGKQTLFSMFFRDQTYSLSFFL